LTIVIHVVKVQNLARQLANVEEKVLQVTIMAKYLQACHRNTTAWRLLGTVSHLLVNKQSKVCWNALSRRRLVSVDDEATSALAAMTVSRGKKQTNSKKR